MTDTARWWPWLRERPLAADSLLALALLGVQLLTWAAMPRDLLPLLPAVASTVAEAACVAVRRRFPWVAVTGVAAVGAISVAGFGSAGLGLMVIGYTAAANQPLRSAMAATAVLWLPTLGIGVVAGRPDQAATQVPPTFLFAFNVLVALVCFSVGRLVRTRRAYVDALEERARAAEANQRALAGQAVAEERRRIARELHDLVAHHIAVMSVLATGARRAAAREPVAADQALITIEETGRTVLREMRRLLHVLRADAEPAGELAPQPGLAGVEVLVEQVREAGLPVALLIEGEPGPLDPGVALAVYRVVQEALTNVLKHAGPAAAAQVRISRGETWLAIEVFDTGRGPMPGTADAINLGISHGVGHGLVSMRERLAVYGGVLRTGPRPGGGFRVYARIPTDQLASPDPTPGQAATPGPAANPGPDPPARPPARPQTPLMPQPTEPEPDRR